jgi:hypothetical protein
MAPSERRLNTGGLELYQHAVALPSEKRLGGKQELSLSTALTELTRCCEFHFNKTPFTIRPVILLWIECMAGAEM